MTPTPKIYYEDNHLLVVHKPENIPVQEDKSGDTDLLNTLKAYIGQKYSKPGKVFLGLVHRLDRPVHGIIVFARTSKAASRLSDQFRNRTVVKKYLVIVEGRADKTGRLEHVLDKDHENNKVTVHPAGSGKGKLAVLHYRLISHKNGLSLIEVELETGRPHQIRVQLTASGLPVWGDYKYGKIQPDGRRIALMSYILEFDHPTREERLRFEADKPAGEPWNQFSA
ncbi:MAG: RluA family pseudouridine synthase [Rhodothermaceae bacterium]|nr:RluA family pseudouridine synthase [Rhodothermaceae bacterium]